jgi:hypothetical protein
MVASENVKEPVFTTGQLAEILGCDIRSIYRWEQSGVIPAPSRVERGGVKARVYTAAEVEQIREKVKDRISFTATVRQGGLKRRSRREPMTRTNPRRVVVLAPKEGKKRRNLRSGPRKNVKVVRSTPVDVEELAVPPEYGSQFIGAVRFAQKHGCLALTVTAPDGKTRTFTQTPVSGPTL